MIQPKTLTLTEQIFANQKLKQELVYTSPRTGLKIFEGNIKKDNFVGVASKNYDFRQNKPIIETIRTFVLPEGHKLRQKGIFEIFTQTNSRGDKTIGLVDDIPEVVSHGDKKNSPEDYKALLDKITQKTTTTNELNYSV